MFFLRVFVEWHPHTSLSCVNACLLSPVGLNYVQQTRTSCSSQESTQPSVLVVFAIRCTCVVERIIPLCFLIRICLSQTSDPR